MTHRRALHLVLNIAELFVAPGEDAIRITMSENARIELRQAIKSLRWAMEEEIPLNLEHEHDFAHDVVPDDGWYRCECGARRWWLD